MLDFTFYTPTKVLFGKNSVDRLGECTDGCSCVLIVYGSDRVEKNGLLPRICSILSGKGIRCVLLGGVQPNPRVEKVREGIALARREKADLLLAVGGGSVIDTVKGIGLGLTTGKDPWELIQRHEMPTRHFPTGCVLTIAAAGSEMSDSLVLTNGKEKRSLSHDLLRPDFSILDPLLTLSVSRFQTGCGTVDIMMHTFERYFTGDPVTEPTDSMAEALLRSVRDAGAVAAEHPENYEARATLMWAASLSHNGLTGCGKHRYFPVHKLEHEFSGILDVAHGAGLSVLFPAWAQYVCRYDLPRFSRIARVLWAVEGDDSEQTAMEGIARMKAYFASIGMPVTMGQLGADSTVYDLAASMTAQLVNGAVKSYIPLRKEDILKIYALAE